VEVQLIIGQEIQASRPSSLTSVDRQIESQKAHKTLRSAKQAPTLRSALNLDTHKPCSPQAVT
jgi:hypothetical protein